MSDEIDFEFDTATFDELRETLEKVAKKYPDYAEKELKKEGINSAMESVKKLLSKNKKTPSTIKYEVREALRRKYMQIIGREPVIFVSLYIDDIIEENKEQIK